MEPSGSELKDDIGPGIQITKTNERDQRMESAITPTPMATNPIHFTEINEHCLDLILRYLDPMDLVNISVAAGGHIKDMARHVFERKFTAKIMVTTGERHSRSSIDSNTCTFLEKFGDLITDIMLDVIDYDNSSSKILCFDIGFESLDTSNSIIQSQTNYTAVEKKLSIHGLCFTDEFNPTLFQYLQNQFESVEHLVLKCVSLDDNVDLSKWFPNLRSILLDNLYTPGVIEYQFPNLTKFHIINTYNIWIRANSIGKMLSLNPQITDIAIQMLGFWEGQTFISECDIFDAIANSLPHLTHLSLWPFFMHRDRHYVTLDAIDVLEILIPTWDSGYEEFIMKHNTLKTLKMIFKRLHMIGHGPPSFDMEKLIFGLPNLKSFEVSDYCLALDPFEIILHNNETLDSLTVSRQFIGRRIGSEYFTGLGHTDKWNISESNTKDTISFVRK